MNVSTHHQRSLPVYGQAFDVLSWKVDNQSVEGRALNEFITHNLDTFYGEFPLTELNQLRIQANLDPCTSTQAKSHIHRKRKQSRISKFHHNAKRRLNKPIKISNIENDDEMTTNTCTLNLNHHVIHHRDTQMSNDQHHMPLS